MNICQNPAINKYDIVIHYEINMICYNSTDQITKRKIEKCKIEKCKNMTRRMTKARQNCN